LNLVTLDFETYYAKDYSLSKLTTEEYIRDPQFEVILVSVKVNQDPPQWFSGTMEDTRTWLQQFDIPSSALLCHHTNFDGLILSHHFGIVPRFYMCTMSMAKPIHGMTIGVSLDALADKYTVGVKGKEVVLALGKRRLDFTPAELARYANYCCNDVQLTYMLLQILKQEIPRQELKVIDCLVRMFCDPVLQLDVEALERHLVAVKEKKAALLAKIEETAGKGVLMSNPQFADLLERLGVDPPKKISPATRKETWAFSKADVEFKKLLEHHDERVQAVVAARLGVKSTLEETRIQRMIDIGRRGTWPVYLYYYGAKNTGRASGGDKLNPQNNHRGGAVRKAIHAPPGHTLVVGDSAQIEARVVAWLAGQDDLVQDFANGVDIYSKFASLVYDRPINRKLKVKQANGEDVYPDATAGFVGKTCILGLGFGLGPVKFQNTLAAGVGGPVVKMTLPECTRIVYSVYRGTYSRIPKLWDTLDKALFAVVRGENFTFGPGGILYTSEQGIHLPNGMIIRYPGLTYGRDGFAYAGDRKQQAEWTRQKLSGDWDFNKLTRIYGGKATENVVQALARIVVFDQMIDLGQRWRVVLSTHDEAVLCVPDERVQEARADMERAMRVAPAWAPSLPISCEVGVHRVYGLAK
jgi:DNA polymerase